MYWKEFYMAKTIEGNYESIEDVIARSYSLK